jgi:hypothetical protein
MDLQVFQNIVLSESDEEVYDLCRKSDFLQDNQIIQVTT